MTIEHLQPSGLFPAQGMSHVVVATGRTAYIAGQGAYDENFQLVGRGDLFTQTLQVFSNLRAALQAVGATPQQIVASTIYIVDLTAEKTDTLVRAMGQALDGEPFPPNASTLVGVTQLAYPEMLIEISAIAVLGDARESDQTSA
jgi:2-iminobutanoate/2-iminopropanoate deaminase